MFDYRRVCKNRTLTSFDQQQLTGIEPLKNIYNHQPVSRDKMRNVRYRLAL